MKNKEVVSVLLLSSAIYFAISALGLIIGMVQTLAGLDHASQLLLKELFTILRDNAIAELWLSAALGFCGMYYAVPEGEIRDLFYVIFPAIALVGTIVALFFTWIA